MARKNGYTTPGEWQARKKKDRDFMAGLPAGIEVRLSAVRISKRPERETDWNKNALHFSCTIQISEPRQKDFHGEIASTPHHVFYSMGSAHRVWDDRCGGSAIDCEPLPSDVLYSLISDARLVEEYTGIDDFAAEFCNGQPVSRVIESWEQCKATDRYLTQALGANRQAVEEYFSDF